MLELILFCNFIIVNINKDENKSIISNQFSLKNDLWSFLTFWFLPLQNSSPRSVCGGGGDGGGGGGGGGGGRGRGIIIFKRELIWNEWFIFIFIDIYNS